MSNESIVQITADSGEIYALTDSGKVAYFDKSVGMFVLKCSGDVLGVDKANVLKRTEASTISRPQGRYRAPVEQAPKKQVSRIEAMITPVNVAIGLVALAIAIYLFVVR